MFCLTSRAHSGQIFRIQQKTNKKDELEDEFNCNSSFGAAGPVPLPGGAIRDVPCRAVPCCGPPCSVSSTPCRVAHTRVVFGRVVLPRVT